MKLLFQTFIFLMFCSTALSQNENQGTNNSTEENYLEFRSKNMFSIYQTNDIKVLEYPLLINIEYSTATDKNTLLVSPEEFIILFNNKEIDLSFIKVSRARDHELSYRIGNTGYVLVGHSEDQIVKKYSQSIK